jgi:hypothetical protein
MPLQKWRKQWQQHLGNGYTAVIATDSAETITKTLYCSLVFYTLFEMALSCESGSGGLKKYFKKCGTFQKHKDNFLKMHISTALYAKKYYEFKSNLL